MIVCLRFCSSDPVNFPPATHRQKTFYKNIPKTASCTAMVIETSCNKIFRFQFSAELRRFECRLFDLLASHPYTPPTGYFPISVSY